MTYMSYATCLGGNSNDYGAGITHNFLGYLVTGETNSTDFPVVNSIAHPWGTTTYF